MEAETQTQIDGPGGKWKTKCLRVLNWKVLMILVLGFFGFVALQSLRGNTHPTAETANLVPVAVGKVVRQDLAQEHVFAAEFRPYQEIDLHAKVAGFVQNITVDIGD